MRWATAGNDWSTRRAASSGSSRAMSRSAILVLSAVTLSLRHSIHYLHFHRSALRELARVVVGADVLAPVHRHGHSRIDSPRGLCGLLSRHNVDPAHRQERDVHAHHAV